MVFKVKVSKVNIVNAPAKLARKSRSRRLLVRNNAYKKAIVTLSPEDRIQFFEGVEWHIPVQKAQWYFHRAGVWPGLLDLGLLLDEQSCPPDRRAGPKGQLRARLGRNPSEIYVPL
jgi:hypothetical protein